MSIRAYGKNAAIELFEHHLVITRRKPGMIADGPSAERLIPFSSIKSVEFVRPGIMAHGRIILTLSGDNSNGCIVAFSKNQARQFEDVLDAVRRAIAAPSIERIAMAATQTSRPIEKSTPVANAAHQEVIVGKQSEHSEDDGQTYDRSTSYDDRTFAPQSRNERRPINSKPGGWWSDMPLLGKAIAVGVSCFLLLALLTRGESGDAGPAPDDIGVPEIIESGAADTGQLAAGRSIIDSCYHYDSCGAFRLEAVQEVRAVNGERLVKAALLYGEIPYAPGDDAPKGDPEWEARPDTYFALCSTVRPLIAFRAGSKWIAETFDFTNSVPGAQQDHSQIYQALCHGYFQSELETNARALGYGSNPDGGRQFEIANPLDLLKRESSGKSDELESAQADAAAEAEDAARTGDDAPASPKRQPSEEELYAPHSN